MERNEYMQSVAPPGWTWVPEHDGYFAIDSSLSIPVATERALVELLSAFQRSTGQLPAKVAVTGALLDTLDAEYQRFARECGSEIIKSWREHLASGQRMEYTIGCGSVELVECT